MAEKHHPQFELCYKKVGLLKRESLGSGSYGAVCKAMCDDLPCAAKIMHPTLLQLNIPGTMMNVMQKFEQECRLLSAIKHPHIVQYLGTYCDPESRLPVLLMELMDESLTRFLERSHEQLSYHTEVNLCHDIALALSYLHSHGIIHRDLSSNNVLLIAGSRAKVADFGMAKLFDMNNAAHLTLCPGTMVYMPPEALLCRPVYTHKLDTFSYGVLCVQIMTRMIPNPGDRVTIVADPRAPAGRIEVPVPEIERRRSHISLITQEHPLLIVALTCLQDDGEKRPSAQEICCHIAQLKSATLYRYSVQLSRALVSHFGHRERQIRELRRQHSEQVQRLEQQLQSKDDQLLERDRQLQTHLQQKEQKIQEQRQEIQTIQDRLTATNEQLRILQEQPITRDQQLAGKDHQLQQKEVIIATCQQEIQQLRQQLQSSEQVTAEFQQNLLERDKKIQDLQGRIQELYQRQEEVEASQRWEEVKVSCAAAGRMKMRWRDGGRAPCKMWGKVAAVNGSVALLRSDPQDRTIYSYDSSSRIWSQFPKCPNHGFSLAIVHGLLTVIGGKTPNGQVTNSLLSFAGSKWTERFPAMPTKRWLTAVVCNGWYLVVAGGIGESDKNLGTVEVMDLQNQPPEWSTASSLPHPLIQATATICGDQVYMLGGRDQNHKKSKSVFTCSLATLLQSCQPQYPRAGLIARLRNALADGPRVWRQLAETPVTLSTCASLLEQPLAVGGEDSDGNKTTAIHMYNTTTNSWEVISDMATPRCQCLVAILSHNELMVVGGRTSGDITDSVEFLTIV